MKLVKILIIFVFIIVSTYSCVNAIDMYLTANDLNQENTVNNIQNNETAENTAVSAPTNTRYFYYFFWYQPSYNFT